MVVPLWRHEDCENKLQQNFGTSYKLAETAICAGELGHDACDVNDHFYTNIVCCNVFLQWKIFSCLIYRAMAVVDWYAMMHEFGDFT